MVNLERNYERCRGFAVRSHGPFSKGAALADPLFSLQNCKAVSPTKPASTRPRPFWHSRQRGSVGFVGGFGGRRVGGLEKPGRPGDERDCNRLLGS